MSSPTPSRLDADTVDPNKTAKFLANLQRTVGRRDPDDAPIATAPAPVATSSALRQHGASLPVHAEVSEPAQVISSAEPTTSPATATPAARTQPARPKRGRAEKSDRMQVEVTLDPGTASRVVYVRVDKTLADRLALIAFQNKINGGEGPSTINDIGVAALNRWLDDYEQAA